jgi:hypothetical protein
MFINNKQIYSHSRADYYLLILLDIIKIFNDHYYYYDSDFLWNY